MMASFTVHAKLDTRDLKELLQIFSKQINIMCANGLDECDGGETCCKRASGDYNCCPLPMAVCCADLVHCCPNGYTCGDGGACIQGKRMVARALKSPAISRELLTEKKTEQ